MVPARLVVLALLASLAGCGGKQADGPERKTAAGEVLGGSISDAMLPLDTVESQNPPLREGAGGEDGETAGDAGRLGADKPDKKDKAAPAASPSSSPPTSDSSSPPVRTSASPSAPADN
jgi:hypothetical protein